MKWFWRRSRLKEKFTYGRTDTQADGTDSDHYSSLGSLVVFSCFC